MAFSLQLHSGIDGPSENLLGRRKLLARREYIPQIVRILRRKRRVAVARSARIFHARKIQISRQFLRAFGQEELHQGEYKFTSLLNSSVGHT